MGKFINIALLPGGIVKGNQWLNLFVIVLLLAALLPSRHTAQARSLAAPVLQTSAGDEIPPDDGTAPWWKVVTLSSSPPVEVNQCVFSNLFPYDP